jgi:hypothetical protein
VFGEEQRDDEREAQSGAIHIRLLVTLPYVCVCVCVLSSHKLFGEEERNTERWKGIDGRSTIIANPCYVRILANSSVCVCCELNINNYCLEKKREIKGKHNRNQSMSGFEQLSRLLRVCVCVCVC